MPQLSTPIPRCPNVPGGGPSLPRTSWRSRPSYDGAPDDDEGAVLRREGLYSSHIAEWRKTR